MDTFDTLQDLDNEIHNVFEKNCPIVIELSKADKIPKTSTTFLLFIAKTNFIKEGIFDLYESKNLYAINILYRSLIEHYLRFQYMFFRLAKEKNDSIGEEYLKFCALSENIDTGKAWKDVARVLDQNSTVDPYDVLKEMHPDFKKYSKEEIISKSKQFTYKNIIRYIDSHINKEKQYSNSSFLLNIIPEYSDLSSFVHGGPNADRTLFDHVDRDILEIEIRNKIELSFFMAATVKQLSFVMLYQYDKRLGQAYNDISAILKKTTP